MAAHYASTVVRHLALSAIFVAVGLGLVLRICSKYEHPPTTVKRFSIAAAAVMATVAGISASATTTSGACPDNPIETCHYNDSTPAIAGVVAVFFIVCAIRARIIYFER